MSSELAGLKPVYLIYGAEELLLEQAVNRLRAKLSGATDADMEFNLDVFDGENAEASQVIAAANTLPFMSERRLVILRNADKMATDGLNQIADYAGNPNPDTSLVLVATKIAKNMRVYKAIDALGGAAEYKAPAKRDYPRTVVDMFAARGRKLGLEGAEVLVRAVGYDLRRLSVEIEKVIAFTGEERTLSRHDVEQVMSTTAPTSVFDFLDAIGSRDCRSALKLLANLLGEGESIHGIHAMTVRHVRSLLSIRAILDRPDGAHSPDAIAKEVGLIPWQARNLVRQAQRFSGNELVDALRGCAAAEEQMKTSRDPRLAFERWLIAVCG